MRSFLGPLLSALGYTLLIIVVGYLMRHFRVLNDAEAGGLSRFCAIIALPCALFASVADLDWSSVNWTLLLGMFISKVVIFAFTSAAALSRSRNAAAIGRAGLFSIFTTKSNDIAFAVPIVNAIFPPMYAKMVYLFVPLQLAIINPVGLLMMEYGSPYRKKGGGGSSWWAPLCRCTRVLFGMLLSPVMVAVFSGLLVNVTLRGKVPSFISQFVEYCGEAYTSTALLSVGISLKAGSGRGGPGPVLDGVSVLVGCALIVVKVFVAALVMYHVCGVLTHYDATTVQFAFLYGCMPPAPTVYVWARQYAIATELTGRMLVASLVVATPLIVVTGIILDLGASRDDVVSTRGILDVVLTAIDVLALGSCLWLLVAFSAGRRLSRGLRSELVPLIVANGVASVSGLACVHASAHAARLPLDAARQLAYHLSVCYAAALAARLFRSLRLPPERMRAERWRWHAGCWAVSLALFTWQIAHPLDGQWEPNDPRRQFECNFGLLNARAPVLRVIFLALATVFTAAPLLLFNVRYLRTEMRLSASCESFGALARKGAQSEDDKYSISIVRSSADTGAHAQSPSRASAQPQPQSPSGASDTLSPLPSQLAPALAHGELGERADGRPSPAFEGGDETSLGNIMQAVRARAATESAAEPGLRTLARTWTFDDGRRGLEGMPSASDNSSSLVDDTSGRTRGDSPARLGSARALAAGGAHTPVRGSAGSDDEEDEEAGGGTPTEHDDWPEQLGAAAGSNGGGENPWIEIRITRRRSLPPHQHVAFDLRSRVGSAIAQAARAGGADGGGGGIGGGGLDAVAADVSRYGAPPAQLRTSLLHSAHERAPPRREPAPADEHRPPLAGARAGPLFYNGGGGGASAMRMPGGVPARSGINYIPMMESLVWGVPREEERDAHAQLLNETFNDSLRYLMVLSAAIFSAVLNLSIALQDLASPRLTTLQVEIVLVAKLAFHAQAMLMLACFGFHPDVIADMRRLGRRLRARLCRSAVLRRSRSLRSTLNLLRQPAPTPFGPEPGVSSAELPTDTDGHTMRLAVFGRQFAGPRARFE